MKNRLFVLISIIVVLALFACSGVMSSYAYFTTSNVNTTINTPANNGDVTNVIAISNEIELMYYTKDRVYNSVDNVSTTTQVNRQTLRLTADIMLTSDVIITADCHIDLAGYSIITNGHDVNINHGYAGSVLISAGSRTDGVNTVIGAIVLSNETDSVIVCTPNAVVVPDFSFTALGFTFANGTSSCNPAMEDFTDYFKIVQTSHYYVANLAFYMISSVLQTDANFDNTYLDYNELNQYFTADEDMDGNADNTDFSQLNYHAEHTQCSLNHPAGATAPYNCYYVQNDIDLPYHIFCYDVDIEYVSSQDSVLSSSGNVTTNASAVQNVTLTAILSVGSNTYTKDYLIHVIDSTDSNALANVGKSIMLEHLSKYYVELDDNNDSVIDFYGYAFAGEVMLPKYNSALQSQGATYTYQSYSAGSPNTLLDSTDNISVDTLVSTVGHFRQETGADNGYIIVPNIAIDYLVFTCTVEGVTVTSDYLPVRGSSVSIIQDNTTIAQNIVSQWYGQQITIRNSLSAYSRNGYSYEVLKSDVTAYASRNVTSVSYVLVNNTDNVYAIDNSNFLYVQAGYQPNITQTVFVNATFVFTENNIDTAVTITIPVVYDDSNAGGETQINRFLPYYVFFNRMFEAYTNQHTYTTYEMPLSYASGNPVVCFDITDIDDNSDNGLNAITMQLYYGGSVKTTLDLGSESSYTTVFDNYLNSNSLTLSALTAYGDAKWIININTDKISDINNKIRLQYNYKFYDNGAYTNEWQLYNDYGSDFILPGILRCVYKDGTTTTTGGAGIQMPDVTLYTWCYGVYCISYDTYLYNQDYADTFIETDWLTREISLINNSNNNMGISNYKGVEYLDNVIALDLSRTDTSVTVVTADAAQYIGGMEALEVLDMSGNALCDAPGGGNAGFPGTDNGFIADLAGLPNLITLDLSNNSIYSFGDLQDLTTLKSLYVYGNSHQSNIGWETVDDLLTDLVNYIYGSEGVTNMSTYQSMYANYGTKVYYINELTYFQGGTSSSDYTRMRNIEYQEILPEGISITTCYANLSTNPDDYGISSPTGTIRNRGITFSYEGDATTSTRFYMTYSYEIELQNGSFTWETGWYTVSMQARFDIERITAT
ncbi:MAG: hypothetical protein PHW00_00920 [Clostridia bacterium]|nr:hypothetical protein [Clostridia bacterium]